MVIEDDIIDIGSHEDEGFLMLIVSHILSARFYRCRFTRHAVEKYYIGYHDNYGLSKRRDIIGHASRTTINI